jgi:phospholipase C
MSFTHAATGFTGVRRAAAVSLSLLQLTFGTTLREQEHLVTKLPKTRSPIHHVIVIVGENRTFDHLFATYQPQPGQTVGNLLSKGIVRDDGTPGPNYWLATQYSATDTAADGYQIAPGGKTTYPLLPAPLTGGPSSACTSNGICTLAEAQASENGLPAEYYPYLLTGGNGQASGVPDARIANVSDLPSGPFQLTSSTFSYDDYAASPTHRFYQMWQQQDCSISHATISNPSGCNADLLPWVETSVGGGANGTSQPTPFNNASTGEGAVSMGFYNVLQGDLPYFKYLADHYAMSDNYHQPVMGGTGPNSLMLGFADALYFSDSAGNAVVPPHNEIENPNAAAGTNNWYSQDGFWGGSYTNCSDTSAPGVAAIQSYLRSLPYSPNPNCDAGHYYLLNNYNPGYFGDGSNAYTDTNAANTVFTVPPTTQSSIADVMLQNHISWKYYGDQWNQYLVDKYQQHFGTVGAASDQYCNICNPFQYQTSVMANNSVRTAHLKDTADLYTDIQNGTLPSVSYVKPSGWVDGHPATSKLDLYEGFVKKIVDGVRNNPQLWQSTAIFITFDEGGGYYDSGYVQPLDYFGDGPRIPMIVVSAYTNPGHISHTYADHVSVVKFIEANWNLPKISGRSRDNLPNPNVDSTNPYVPENSPAIGDLFDLFNFTMRTYR